MEKENTTEATSNPSNRQRGLLGIFAKRRPASPNKSFESDIVNEKDVNSAITPTQQDDEVKSVSFLQLFRFSTRKELFLNAIGLFAAACAGAAQPSMSLIFGNLTQTFVDYQSALSGNAETLAAAEANFMHTATLDACWLILIGGIIGICSWLYMYIWNYTGECASKRIRELYFKAVIRQDIAYFDEVGAGEITTHIETDTHLIQQGLSEKNALVVSNIGCFITGFVIAYARSWRLALVMTVVIPCIVITGTIMTTLATRFTKRALTYMAEGSSIAEEVISSIRTSHAFGTQHALSALYDKPINIAHKFDLKVAISNGIGFSFFLFTVYCMYSLAFYFGTTLVLDGNGEIGVILNVIFAILLGSFTLSQVGVEIQPILTGRAAAAKIFATIDRVPAIDSQSPEGMKPTSVKGEIKLENISFDYPSRANVPILRNLSLHFPEGKTAALVGASGSGKSTVIQLIERFYDPLDGRVTLDGVDIRDLNLKWLRSQISLVSQEPVLFKTTIAGNVEYGLVNTPYEHASPEEKMKLVKEACVKANADSFISILPQGYETLVGERGFLMSGGQKQRIAIARAIVSDPKILLLDEATSALDTQSEGIVQDALDKASAGRTTITIAHRLSTIKNANKIFVMGQGRVLEEGTHDELLVNSEGAYSKLVQAQKIRDLSQRAKLDDSTEEGDDVSFKEDEIVLVKEKVDDHNESVTDINESSRRSMSRSVLDITTPKGNERDDGGIVTLFFRLFTLDRSLIKQYVLGLIFAILQGMVYPSYGILMGKAIVAFSSNDPVELRFQGDRNALWFFVIALCSMLVICGEHYFISRASANVAHLLRSKLFKAMLRQDIQYFDEDQNSTGSLVSKLSDNPQKVNGLLGLTLGTIFQSISTIITGIIIGLIFNWRLALVAMACEPFIVVAGYIRLQVVVAKDKRNKKAHEDSAHFACEAASSIRTVASLTREESCLDIYSKTLEEPLKRSIITALWSNLLYACSNCSIFFVTALAFWFGAKEIISGDLTTISFFIVTFSIIFGAAEAGAIWQFTPDISSAGQAARDINKLLNIVPEIDAESSEGLVPTNVRGEVRFENVHFRYPTRLATKVLRGLDIVIQPGTYVALVGASGCGKSTVIQLIERFYDPTTGRVLLDGQDISQLNVQEYRKHIALVSQEPTLYAGSIKFNILLGATKPMEEVTQEELETVCRDANILEFITSLPNGFDTEVGGKGSHLSGGQKQRIAIARALIRNPRVILLDEATSALDSNSEKIVQAALDQAAKGRTTIAIAHRLSTIQNADKIYFIKEGRVGECGTHDELIRLRGAYYEYVQLQALSKN